MLGICAVIDLKLDYPVLKIYIFLNLAPYQ